MSHRSLATALRAPLAFLSAIVIGAVAISPALAQLPSVAPASTASGIADGGAAPDHLVISELMTGAASASDEFIEIYNPTSDPLPLGGLELVYASASGATVTRKATWDGASPAVPAGGHLLVANEAGIFAAIGDATYANGMAAAGGAVALRIAATAAPVDAVGWGTATAWLEGTAAPAAAAGESLERLPGGTLGSGQDTDDNAVDFVVQAVPDPQNAGSPPIPAPTPAPSATPSPSLPDSGSPAPTATPTDSPPTPTPAETPAETAAPTASPTPTATPTPVPTPTPSPLPATISIADARALPDGSDARIGGVALADSDFVDGGGCVTDGSAGIAVLPEAAVFYRGDRIDAIGRVDDRYAQRTLRVAAGGLTIDGTGAEPQAVPAATGAVTEAFECRLVVVDGVIQAAPTTLSAGLAFDLDDGSGAVRVLVATAASIDTAAWTRGARVRLVGVVGQRDSSGTGTAGYRIQPRDAGDVLAVEPSPTPTPSASGSPGPSPSLPAGLVSIGDARAAATGTDVRVRGVVTLENGLVDDPTAVIQDASGAIVIRLGDGAGTVQRGSLVEVSGTRSTKSGMVTIRTDEPPVVLGSQPEPVAIRRTTGGVDEGDEARLVVVRGQVTLGPTRSTAGNAALSIDDGSGELRVTLFAMAAFPDAFVAKGDWIEVTGVLGQITTGAQPDRGYRLWPRAGEDVRIVAAASATAGGSSGGSAGGSVGDADVQEPVPGHSVAAPSVRGAAPSPARLVLGVPGATDASASGPNGTPEVTLAVAGLPATSLALLLLGLAVSLSLGSVAWRSGALGRATALVRAVAADPSREEDEAA